MIRAETTGSTPPADGSRPVADAVGAASLPGKEAALHGEMFGYAYHHWAQPVADALDASGATIPLDDPSAYLRYPQYRWMFNKLLLSESQGLLAHPHGVEPHEVGVTGPVFSKPIYNLWGLSTGARLVEQWSLADYQAGHFWLPVLPDPQLSTDAVIDNGTLLWTYTMRPVLNERGSFVRWETATAPEEVHDTIRAWVAEHLADFRGVANFETRGRWIIEAPPRMAVQFLDFYGPTWLPALAAFYGGASWSDPGPGSDRGRSLALRVPAEHANTRLWLRDRARLVALEKETGCTVYLPWQDGQRLGDANDDGRSYRFALVNAPDDADAERMAHGLLECLDGLPLDAATAGVLSALQDSEPPLGPHLAHHSRLRSAEFSAERQDEPTGGSAETAA